MNRIPNAKVSAHSGLRTGCSAVLLQAVLAGIIANSAPADDMVTRDCGVNSLYLILQLEGRPVPLDRLDAALPLRPQDGYSMAELKAAARTLGLQLRGVQLSKGDRPLKRPAIAYFYDRKGGHFAVLKPVGTTGTMVQLIDPPLSPQILDYDRLFSWDSWTGRALVAHDNWLASNLALISAAAIGTLLIALSMRRHYGTPHTSPK
jgi:hypothetical protein